MKNSLEEALKNTDTTYNQLVEIANKMIVVYTDEITKLINEAEQNVNNLTNDEIRNLTTKLSFFAFHFGDVKEKSSLKAECAEALRKERYAVEFNANDGSVASRDSNATLNISSEVMVEALYNLVANLFKVKLDEIHRVVDTLKTNLMTRLQEAKLTLGSSVE